MLQVNCVQIAPPIVEELKSLEMDGFKAFDAFLREVLVVAPVIRFIGDNPRNLES